MRKYEIYNNIQPKAWKESMPIGCGRMGATIMAGVAKETLFLNEETVWSERDDNAADPEIREKLKRIRDLFLADKPAAANRLATEIFGSNFPRIGSYESAGKLNIELHEGDAAVGYKRRLDLVNGIACVSYTKGGSCYEREYFASYTDNVIACRITSSKAPISAVISYERERCVSCSAENGLITAIAKTLFGNREFCVKARIVSDGEVASEGDQIIVSGAKTICVYIVIGTEFRYAKNYIDSTVFPDDLDYEALKKRHIADFSALMARADISFPENEGLSELSLNEYYHARNLSRINDGYLYALQWQFGRYLLASSSREGTLPSNLQGLWTDGLTSPWSADYHTNVNLQANYWAAEVANLSECHLPLFDYMNEYLLEPGKKTANDYYGARGCVVHHLSDIYGFTAPADGPWGIWPHGASWLALHMWEHYLFTKDVDFLKNTAYRFISEAAAFFLDTLANDVKGRLVYAPSHSPENRYYIDEDGKRSVCWLASSCTMDTQIISTLFDIYVRSSEILGIENADINTARDKLSALPKMQVGKHGQLMEWIEDYEETEIAHRHVSQAFGLFPASLITRKDADLYKAVEVTLNRRLSGKDSAFSSGMGWTMMWMALLFARLRKPKRAYDMLDKFTSRALSNNLWEIINIPAMGGDVFQIDANLAYVAAVCETLIQSHEDAIAIIPALPDRWRNGSFRGLRARGGYEIDAEWCDGSVTKITVKSKFNGTCRIELPSTQQVLAFCDESGKVYKAENSIITIESAGSITLVACF